MDSLELVELRQHLEDYEQLLLKTGDLDKASIVLEFIEDHLENA